VCYDGHVSQVRSISHSSIVRKPSDLVLCAEDKVEQASMPGQHVLGREQLLSLMIALSGLEQVRAMFLVPSSTSTPLPSQTQV
jgi:hypothetical protein